MNQKLPSVLDLTPLPQVLPTLGEIDFAFWKCLAELVDNAIDGFLDLGAESQMIQQPGVDIWLPTKRSNSPPEVVVVDNGPGLGVGRLRNAVRAGYTSRTSDAYMGLYGVGFNIATARLGWTTEVLTKTAGDNQPIALQIDFEKMQRAQNFQAPLAQVRANHPQWGKVKDAQHFTMVRVFNLREGTLGDFDTAEKIRGIREMLGMVYSPILTDGILTPQDLRLKLGLRLNGVAVRGTRHNVWRVHDAGEGRPACYEINEKVARGTVRGWIGIQRFWDSGAFGIDFVRNGRKIETHNKDLFVCLHNGKKEVEYPTDVHRRGGRIVGEIHINHCRVHYTKDQFNRNDLAWGEMVEIVRGGAEFPLRPQKANERMGATNESKLAKLYSHFRRGDPSGGKKDTIEEKQRRVGAWRKLLTFPDNAEAVKLAQSSPALTSDEWTRKLDASIRQHVLDNNEILPSRRRVRKPRPQRRDAAGALFERIASRDEFVQLILDEISRLKSGETPLAFCLCLRTLVEVTLKRMLERQAPEVLQRISRDRRDPKLSELIRESQKLCQSRPQCFPNSATKDAVYAFVTGLSENSTRFMNSATHGHIMATESKAEDLSKEVSRLMERLLKDEAGIP